MSVTTDTCHATPTFASEVLYVVTYVQLLLTTDKVKVTGYIALAYSVGLHNTYRF